MADVNLQAQELAEVLEQVNDDLRRFGRVSDETQAALAAGSKRRARELDQASKLTADALGELAGVGLTAAKAMYDGEKGAAAFNSAVDGMSKAAVAAGAALTYMVPGGFLIKALIGLGTAAVTASLKLNQAASTMADQLFAANTKMAKSGAAASDGMMGMFRDAKKLGLSMKELGVYTDVVAANSAELALFRGTAFEGRKAFANIGAAMKPFRVSLEAAGISLDDQIEGTAGYLRLQTLIGQSQNKTNQELATGARKYLVEMDGLSKLTGMQRQEIEKQIESALSEQRFRAKLDAMRATKDPQQMAAADQLMRANLMLSKQAPELGQAFRDIQSGALTTDAATKGLISTQGQLMQSSEALSSGQIDANQAVKQIGGAIGQFNKDLNFTAQLGLLNDFAIDYAQGQKLAIFAQQDISKIAAEIVVEQNKQMSGLGDANTRAMAELREMQRNANEKFETTVSQSISTAIAMSKSLVGVTEPIATAFEKLQPVMDKFLKQMVKLTDWIAEKLGFIVGKTVDVVEATQKSGMAGFYRAGGSEAVGSGVGAGVGAAKGAAVGATLGSVVPVIGTAIGALLGGLVGGGGGYLFGKFLGKGADALGSAITPEPRAAGGPVRSQNPYIVGERGPELMVPEQSGNIVNNDRLMNLMQGMNKDLGAAKSLLQGSSKELAVAFQDIMQGMNKDLSDTKSLLQGSSKELAAGVQSIMQGMNKDLDDSKALLQGSSKHLTMRVQGIMQTMMQDMNKEVTSGFRDMMQSMDKDFGPISQTMMQGMNKEVTSGFRDMMQGMDKDFGPISQTMMQGMNKDISATKSLLQGVSQELAVAFQDIVQSRNKEFASGFKDMMPGNITGGNLISTGAISDAMSQVSQGMSNSRESVNSLTSEINKMQTVAKQTNAFASDMLQNVGNQTESLAKEMQTIRNLSSGTAQLAKDFKIRYEDITKIIADFDGEQQQPLGKLVSSMAESSDSANLINKTYGSIVKVIDNLSDKNKDTTAALIATQKDTLTQSQSIEKFTEQNARRSKNFSDVFKNYVEKMTTALDEDLGMITGGAAGSAAAGGAAGGGAAGGGAAGGGAAGGGGGGFIARLMASMGAMAGGGAQQGQQDNVNYDAEGRGTGGAGPEPAAAPKGGPGQQGTPRKTTDGAIYHHTGGRSLSAAVNTLKARGLAYHYMIDRDGSIVPYMPDNAVAYHAGPTDKNPKFGNWNTIGIAALANNNDDLTKEQLAAAVKLNQHLSSKFGFGSQNIFGHGQVTSRKMADEGAGMVKAIQSGLSALNTTSGSAGPPQAETGGVLTGPTEGYAAMLHGTEAVVPLPDGKKIPVQIDLNDPAMVGPTMGGYNQYTGYNMGPMSTDLNTVKQLAGYLGAFDKATQTITDPATWKEIINSGVAMNYELGVAKIGSTMLPNIGQEMAQRVSEIIADKGVDQTEALKTMTQEFKTALTDAIGKLTDQQGTAEVKDLLSTMVNKQSEANDLSKKILQTAY